MPPSFEVPQELIDVIVHFVDDTIVLATLSTVATSFVSPCQRRLFRALTLSPNPDRRLLPAVAKFSRALSLFATSPHLASYVRQLTIILVRNEDPAEDPSNIAHVLEKLFRLRSLVIKGCPVTLGSWADIPSGTATSLCAVLRRKPSFRSVEFTTIAGVPASLLDYTIQTFPGLSMQIASIAHDDFRPLFPRDQSVPLKNAAYSLMELSLLEPRFPDRFCDFFLQPQYQNSLHSLQRLELLIAGYTIPDSGRLLRHSFTSTLAHLVLVCYEPLLVSSSFILPHLPALQTLEFRIEFAHPWYRPRWQHRTVARVVPHLPTSTPALQNLLISVYYAHINPCRSGCPETLLESAAATATYPFDCADYAQRLPCLRRVHCHIETPDQHTTQAGFSAEMRAVFSGPSEAGILRCAVSRSV